MDIKGARELAQRIGSNSPPEPRTVQDDLPEGALPLYSYLGVRAAAPATEPSPPPTRSRLGRLRVSER